MMIREQRVSGRVEPKDSKNNRSRSRPARHNYVCVLGPLFSYYRVYG
jgi:hypothetical protein